MNVNQNLSLNSKESENAINQINRRTSSVQPITIKNNDKNPNTVEVLSRLNKKEMNENNKNLQNKINNFTNQYDEITKHKISESESTLAYKTQKCLHCCDFFSFFFLGIQ